MGANIPAEDGVYLVFDALDRAGSWHRWQAQRQSGIEHWQMREGQSAKAAQFSGSLLSQTAFVLYDSLKPEQSYGRSVRVNLDLEATLLPRLNRSAMLEAERLQTPAEGDHVLCEWPAYCNATLGTGQRVAKCGQILAWDCR